MQSYYLCLSVLSFFVPTQKLYIVACCLLYPSFFILLITPSCFSPFTHFPFLLSSHPISLPQSGHRKNVTCQQKINQTTQEVVFETTRVAHTLKI